MSNPLSYTDTSGLMENPCWDPSTCGGGGGGSGGGICDPGDPTCDPGGCDPIFNDCGGGDGGGIPGPPPPPKIIGYEDLDPNRIMTESLGLPPGMLVPSGDILSMFGVNTQCEFGACGIGPMSLANGTAADGAAPIDMSYLVFFTYAFAQAPSSGVDRAFKKVLDKTADKVIPASPWKTVSGLITCFQNFTNDINDQIKNFPNVSNERAIANLLSCVHRVNQGMIP